MSSSHLYNHPLLTKAKQLRQNLTREERLLWEQLRAHRLNGRKFKRQVPIGMYIVDFSCYASRVIVEIDGAHHGLDETKEYDEIRTHFLNTEGYTVLRFWNHEVTTNINRVLEQIELCCQNAGKRSL